MSMLKVSQAMGLGVRSERGDSYCRRPSLAGFHRRQDSTSAPSCTRLKQKANPLRRNKAAAVQHRNGGIKWPSSRPLSPL